MRAVPAVQKGSPSSHARLAPIATEKPARRRSSRRMWGLLAIVAGLLYGWMTPGRQDKGRLLWNGFLFGIVIALGMALLGAALDAPPLPLGAGFVGLVLTVLILTAVFVAGAWLGDLAEGFAHRGRAA